MNATVNRVCSVRKASLRKCARLLMLAGLMFLWTITGSSGAAEQPKNKTADERGSALNGPALRTGDLYALVVGISEYQNPTIGKLNRSHIDAKDFADFLKTQDKVFRNLHVTLLTNSEATRQAVETHLKYKLKKALKDDTIIVFLSGHGAPDPSSPSDFYFVTYDAAPEYLGASSVKMSGLEFAKQYDAQRVLVIADACHAGGFSFLKQGTNTKSLAPAMELFLREIQESSGIATILSSKPGESSWDVDKFRNSVFTHYLLEGLRGKADRDRNGIVTLDEAYHYAYKRTKAETGGAQTPQRAAGDVVGSFPLSYVGSNVGIAELRQHLLRAAESGNVDMVQELVDAGVHVDCRDRENNTALIVASQAGRTHVVTLLLKNGANPEDINNDGNTALICAAERGHKEVVDVLLSAGADVNAQNREGEKALTQAAREGQTEVVRLLLDKGANIKARTNTGNTPLSLASYRGHAEIVKLLLDKGADVNLVDDSNRTALSLAARYGHSAIVKLLMDKGAAIDADTPGKKAKGPAISKELLRSALLGDAAKVRQLLGSGTDIHSATDSGDTALTLAAGLGQVEVVKALLEKGADVNARTSFNSNALMWACYNGRVDVVKALLSAGAAVNVQDNSSWTALMYATKNGHKSIVELLIAKAANVDLPAEEGDTALTVASEKGYPPIVKILLDKGADLKARKKDDSTALILAAENGHTDVVRLLVSKGADINAQRPDGTTGLMLAAGKGHLDVVQLLANKGANINTKNKRGSTALILAAGEGRLEVVKVLLAKGAQAESEDWEGMTAEKVASIGGYGAVARLLNPAKR
jgi:ankyrin repeat protein